MSFIRSLTTQDELETKGVSLVNFCSENTIDQLKKEFDHLHPSWTPTMENEYYFSIFGGDQKYWRTIQETMFAILKPDMDKLFFDYEILAISLQVKGVGGKSAVNIHQDLSVVDESKHKSFTLWIPLQDSTDDNGPLSFLECSQHAFRTIRAHSIQYLFENVEDYVYSNSKVRLAKKGEALMFDTATLHYSTPNFSESPRISLGISLIDKGAKTEIYHYDKFKPFDGTLDRYAVPIDFWLRYNNFEKERLLPPKFGKRIGSISGVQVLPYNRSSFISKYEAECRRRLKDSSD